MLHVRVLLIAPLGTCHIAESGTDQQQSRVSIRKRPYPAGSAANLTVQPLDRVVGADTRPAFAGKVP